MNRVRWNRLVLLVAVLAPICQLGFHVASGLPTIPLEILWLPLLALWVLLTADREDRLPFLSWPQVALLCLLPVGLLGLTGTERLSATRELVQLALLAVLAPYVYRACLRRLSWPDFAAAMAIAFPVLLCSLVLPVSGLSSRKGGMMLVMVFPFLLATLRRLPTRWAVAGTAMPGLLAGLALPHGGLVVSVVVALGVMAWAARDMRRLVAIAAIALLAASFVSPFTAPWRALSPHRDAEHLRRGTIEWLATCHAPAQYPVGAGLGSYQPAINRLRGELPQRPHPEDNRVPKDGNSQYAVALVESGPLGLVGVLLFLGLSVWSALQNKDERGAVTAGSLAGILVGGSCSLLFVQGIGIWVGGMVGLAALPGESAPRRAMGRWLGCGVAVLALALLAYAGNEDKREPGAPSHLNRVLTGFGTMVSPLRVVVVPDPLATGTAQAMLRVEAEAATEVQAPFAVVSLSDASGGQGLVVPDRSGKGRGSAQFVVQVPKAGTYALYARVYWDDGCSNSLAFRIAGQPTVVLASETYERWHTLEAGHPLTLPQGELRVELMNLEDGIRLDYWGLRPL